MEPPERKQVGNHVCIPGGTYKVRIKANKDTRFDYDVIELLEVPGRSDILIHIGNYPKDTLGCLLTGMDHDVDFVSDSKKAYDKLFLLVVKALDEESGEFYINVVG